jgi:hypothetical protein
MPIFSVGEAARELGCQPKLLTDWLYLGKLDSSRCPIFCGRRQIPASYLPSIAAMLKRGGYSPAVETRDAS